MQQKHIKLIPGEQLSKRKLARLKQIISGLAMAAGDGGFRRPRLEIFQLGQQPESSLYVNMKVKSARAIGIDAHVTRVAENSTNAVEELNSAIENANSDPSIDGIMVQSPLPGVAPRESLQSFSRIAADKDVDGLTGANLGRLWQHKGYEDVLTNRELFIAATPLGTLDCLHWVADDANSSISELVAGKKVLVINRSNIVGKPLAALMTALDGTVTIAHSQTNPTDLQQLLASSDIILSATSIPDFIDAEMLRPGQIVIDIGINKSEGRIRGDVTEVSPRAGGTQSNLAPIYIAPVPGGVGPLTVSNLLLNTVMSYSRNTGGKYFNYKNLLQ